MLYVQALTTADEAMTVPECGGIPPHAQVVAALSLRFCLGLPDGGLLAIEAGVGEVE